MKDTKSILTHKAEWSRRALHKSPASLERSAADSQLSEQGYRYSAVLLHRDDDKQAEALDSGIVGGRNWKASTNQLFVPDHTSHNEPSAAQWSSPSPSLESLPDTQGVEVERLVNGRPRDWSLVDPAKELVFPLTSNYLQEDDTPAQPGPVHTPYPSVNTGHFSNAAVPYSNGNYVSAESSSPSKQGPFPSKPINVVAQPINVAAQPFYPSRRESPSSAVNGGKIPNFRKINYRPQTADEVGSQLEELLTDRTPPLCPDHS
ncbi:hypothetical protein EYF80_004096 [Liparis tanakae]|uniref:Uncharacterized protein n=1 Tax=Liparis tanakae TaxID=230148 RepID=A0A4Z2J6G1_9TELE|nr:hypothetical protein EYF80_004096 [Liparis tanakae]